MKRLQLLRSESLSSSLKEEERNSIRDSLMSYIEHTPVDESMVSETPQHDKKSRKGIAILILLILVAGLLVVALVV